MQNNFRTVIKSENYPFKIDYSSKTMFIGSCFSDNIGEKLDKNKFNCDINPFGVLYNPVSIKRSIDLLTHEIFFSGENLFFHNDLWNSFYHHSKFSDVDKERALEKINGRIKHSADFLSDADFLFITLGTAWVFESVETGEIVSNCHKLPAEKFKRRLLNSDEITIEYFQLINNLQNYNPDIKIIFTISPIRHLKDGFVQNQISKSILHVTVNQIQEHYANCYYFPAYEIMMDDLRDYRFYASDMLHPSEIAIEYLFDFFSNSFFDENTKTLKDKISKLLKAFEHRPFNENTGKFKEFATKTLVEIENIQKIQPNIDFKEIKSHFEKYI